MNVQKDKWLLPLIILLAAFFIFKLVDQSKILFYFPLDQNNDISSHIGQLFFLKQYGFHAIVPNWYSGFKLFLTYPPGYFLFALPLYLAAGNIQSAVYISHILVYLIGLLFFILLGKHQKFSLEKTLFFYLLFYANPIAVGNFIKLGRLPELFSLTLFVLLFAMILRLKGTPIRIKEAILFGIVYAAVLLAHPSSFIISSLIILPLFVVKNNKEKIILVLSIAASILLTSFWTIPFFLTSLNSSSMLTVVGLDRLLRLQDFFFDNLFSFITPAAFFLVALFYFKSIKGKKAKRKEVLFYSPVILFSLLYLFRVAAFLPLFNKPYPDSYNLFFIFLSVFLFLKIPLEAYRKNLRRLIKIFLALLPFLIIIPTMIFVPNFRVHNAVDRDVIALLPSVNPETRFFIKGIPYPSSHQAMYTYAAVFYSLSTPEGWLPQATTWETIRGFIELEQAVQKGDCEIIRAALDEFKARELLVFKDYCNNLKNCGMISKGENANACLYIYSSLQAGRIQDK